MREPAQDEPSSAATREEPASLRVQSLPTLRQQIVERMREAIETGQFPPGTRLIERDLCERMGVSRPSIREALRELEAAGLITTVPNRGPIISVVTPEMARSIYEVRAVLEGLAARLFARRASSAQMTALKASVEVLAGVYANFTTQGFLKAKTEFYRVLFEGSGNPVASDMLRMIHTRVSQLRATSLGNPARAKESIGEIREFVAAIESRNEEAAWHTCMRHIQNAADSALRVLETNYPVAAGKPVEAAAPRGRDKPSDDSKPASRRGKTGKQR